MLVSSASAMSAPHILDLIIWGNLRNKIDFGVLLKFHIIDNCKFDQIVTYSHTQVYLDMWLLCSLCADFAQPCMKVVQSLEVSHAGDVQGW